MGSQDNDRKAAVYVAASSSWESFVKDCRGKSELYWEMVEAKT